MADEPTRWTIRDPRVPRGLTLRGYRRAGGRIGYMVRFRVAGRETERTLDARTEAQAIKAARAYVGEVERLRAMAHVEAEKEHDPRAAPLYRSARMGASSPRWLDDLEAYVQERINEAAVDDSPDKAISWAEGVKRYLTSLRARGRRAKTVGGYSQVLTWIGDATDEGLHLSDLTPDTLADLWADIEAAAAEQELAAASLLRRRRDLHAFLGWARQAKYLRRSMTRDAIDDALPAVEVARPTPNPLEPGEDLVKLVKAARRRDRELASEPALEPVVWFLLATGCRLEECAGATWDEFNKACDRWRLKSARAKTKRARTVDLVLAPSVVTMLRRLRLAAGGRGPVFLGRDGRWDKTALSKALIRLGESYGAPAPSNAQRLRQTAASVFSNWAKIGPTAAAGRLGHSSETRWSSYLDPSLQRAIVGETIEEAYGLAGLVGQQHDQGDDEQEARTA